MFLTTLYLYNGRNRGKHDLKNKMFPTMENMYWLNRHTLVVIHISKVIFLLYSDIRYY